MDTQTETIGVNPDTQAVLDSFASGKPVDPAKAKRVRENGKNFRQQILETHGIVDIGVPAIRELRGNLPE